MSLLIETAESEAKENTQRPLRSLQPTTETNVMQSLRSEQLPHTALKRAPATEAKPLRVLHVHSGNLYGGVEMSLMTQARHRHLCPAMELSFALCFAGQFSKELAALGAPVHWLGNVRVRQPMSVWRARQRLHDLLRRERFEVVVTHSAWSQAIFGPVARTAHLPLVFWLRGLAKGKHWLERWAGRTPPDFALCNSHFTASTLPKLFPHVRAEVIYNPLISSAPRLSQAERSVLRAELETPEEAVVIVQVSRMEAWKGHELHLRALSLLKEIPGWICWQVGGAQRPHEARYMEKLKGLAITLGIADRVRFLGWRSDVSHLLPAADIHCQPNTGPEPFGNVFIEALSAQLPVVTTAIGGAREIVDESCGMLVESEAAALAAVLQRLIQDQSLRLKLGAAGPARARKLCDAGTQLDRISNTLSCFVQQDRMR